MSVRRLASLSAIAFTLYLAPSVYGFAQILIQNNDPPNVGFNDPTPAAPVGGNPANTVGHQRLVAFQAAAIIWGNRLTSSVPITVAATWEALSCTATSATLGSAGAISIWSDFDGAPKAATWFGEAEANAISGTNLSGGAQLRARFNVNLGQPNCLTGTFFYYGLDHNEGTDIDFLAVLLHEMGHGLGFQTYTDGFTGEEIEGLPSIWDWYLYDLTVNKYWYQMTDAERSASAINTRRLIWGAPGVTVNVPKVLQLGTPLLQIGSPASIAGAYQVGTATFGPPLDATGVSGRIAAVVEGGVLGLACTPLDATNAAAVNGNIALISRGSCAFTIKVKNAQDAGAMAVVIADNVAGSPPAGMSGDDPTITIPSVRVTLDDGTAIYNAISSGSTVNGTLGLEMSIRAGADSSNHIYMYTPNPYAGGSSVSHYDTLATPNQLMEPFINSDLPGGLIPPVDLTYPLLVDIGWPH